MQCWFPVLLRLAIAGPALQPQPLHQVTVHPPFQRTSEDFRMVDQPQPKVIEVLTCFHQISGFTGFTLWKIEVLWKPP